MSVEEALRTLARGAADDLEPVLRKAYELGYREGLAQAPRVEAPPPAAAAPPTEDRPAPPETDPDEFEPEDPSNDPPAPPPVDWGQNDGPASEHPAHAQSDGARPIFPHATIGTLLARIYEHFALDRFDIDVVVCRKGDKSRRQLKKSVKLGKYAVEG